LKREFVPPRANERRVGTLVLLLLLLSLSIASACEIRTGHQLLSAGVSVVYAQSQVISTDKPVYVAGDTVTIDVTPPPATGMTEWLIITPPWGPDIRVDLSDEQSTTEWATLTAGPLTGQYKVNLWGEQAVANASPSILASTSYEVAQPSTASSVTIQGWTAITNLKYPPQVTLQNGIVQGQVTFTVTYADPDIQDGIIFGIWFTNPGPVSSMNTQLVDGTGSAGADPCLTTWASSSWPGKAACAVWHSGTDGSEEATFTLSSTAPSAQQYVLFAGAEVVDSSGNLVAGSLSEQEFTVSVTSTQPASTSSAEIIQTTQTTLTSDNTSMTFLGLFVVGLTVLGVIALVARRGVRRSSKAETAEVDTGTTAPTTVRAEGVKFCRECGARIPPTASFCRNCGQKQPA
jgi:hypothetical protein